MEGCDLTVVRCDPLPFPGIPQDLSSLANCCTSLTNLKVALSSAAFLANNASCSSRVVPTGGSTRRCSAIVGKPRSWGARASTLSALRMRVKIRSRSLIFPAPSAIRRKLCFAIGGRSRVLVHGRAGSNTLLFTRPRSFFLCGPTWLLATTTQDELRSTQRV